MSFRMEKNLYIKKGKFCICGLKVANRTKICPKCNHEFKKKLNNIVKQVTKQTQPEKQERVYTESGRGRIECSCGLFYGCRLESCPSCSKPKSERIIKKEPLWPDNWANRAREWATKLNLSGTAVYASSYHTEKPLLSLKSISEWADNTIYEHHADTKQREFLTSFALRSILRRFYSSDELEKAFKFLREWEKTYEEIRLCK